MNYTISRIYNCPGIRYRKIWLYLEDSIYCLSHNFRFSLYRASSKVIFLKYIIPHGIVHKVAFHLFNGMLYIIKVYSDVLIHI